MDGGGEDFALRRVVPVAHCFSDGVWVGSVEVWDHGVVIRWAKPEQARPSSFVPVAGLILSDDLGTRYTRRGGGASRNRRGSLGHAEFEPSPPPAAISLTIGGEKTDDLISVALPD